MQVIKNAIFAGSSDAEFENKSTNVSVQLADKTVFDPPFPELDALVAAVKALSAALVPASNGGRIEVSKKNLARKAVEKLLVKAAAYVAFVAGDNVTLVLTAGFEARKPREPRPAITAPE